MCSIIGSFDKDKVIALCELNAYRGQHSHSISYASQDGVYYTQKNFGPINYDALDPDGDYMIVHMQAPTTDNKNADCIHPAMNPYAGDLLWHNGIIKEKEVERLREKYQLKATWDTYILLHHLIVGGSPSDIDGTFSCLWCDYSSAYGRYGLKLFRNEISPMFIDSHSTISSTRFEGSVPTEPNVMFGFDPWKNSLYPHFTFDTKENPYYFGE
jgi:glutamine phosphoribosylpyrophosphate amidotransferase